MSILTKFYYPPPVRVSEHANFLDNLRPAAVKEQQLRKLDAALAQFEADMLR